MRRISSLLVTAPLLASLAFHSIAPTARAEAYDAHPKLVVILVIDQFRGDMLERYRSEFKGRGFRLFLNDGAWFPDCYYNYANTKTAPGHATIGTGAYTDGHGINSNEWWDARTYDRPVSSVEDERYKLVDLPTGTSDSPGASPRNLLASTLGDELRLATEGRSQVWGVSLKDRAAILPPGHAANGAFWLDDGSGHFTTSTYYMEHLPAWATAFNSSDELTKAAEEAGIDAPVPFSSHLELTPAANHYELDFAQALITGEKLGQGKTTDLLTVSLSAHDLVGHRYGPDSEQEEKMVLGLDRDLDRFFSWLDKTVGLRNVWIALSADHGVAPVPAFASSLGMNAAIVDLAQLNEKANAELNRRFSPDKNLQYILPIPDLPYITLDRRVFESARISEKTAEEALSEALRKIVPTMQQKAVNGRVAPVPEVVGTYTRLQLASSETLPDTEMGRELAHSYSDHGNWYVMLMLAGYQMQDQHSTGTTHFSPWSYDRHVPLAFYGSAFKPGTYRGRVEPVDIAATFASLLGVNQPSASVGHVLTQAIQGAETVKSASREASADPTHKAGIDKR
ncbi:alkaline phosphatase family protein [Acidicapsa dinghuensis]|uniref:Alkaline phosphatase family protein n=1 Tax=Acidicapsa dinghuensis TaxID=2218256 RepID=A0ABW1EKH3_9BACT|nr:alkaline phosphatase family protein [Acidicapsa dinghuensis]